MNRTLTRRQTLLLTALGLAGALALLWHLSYLDGLLARLWDFGALLQDRARLQTLIESWGAWGPLFFMLFQALQVVIVPIPGEATAGLASGYVFGPWKGFVYTLIGLTVGSLLAYQIGRWLGAPLLHRLLSEKGRRQLEELMPRQGALAAILIFALPYFPKDYFCVALGMAGMPIRIFLLAVTLGRLPNALLFNLKGAYLSAGEYLNFFLLMGAFLVVAGLVFYFRERLSRLLARLG